MHVAMPRGVLPGCSPWRGDGIVQQRRVVPSGGVRAVLGMEYLRELCQVEPNIGVDTAL